MVFFWEEWDSSRTGKENSNKQQPRASNLALWDLDGTELLELIGNTFPRPSFSSPRRCSLLITEQYSGLMDKRRAGGDDDIKGAPGSLDKAIAPCRPVFNTHEPSSLSEKQRAL